MNSRAIHVSIPRAAAGDRADKALARHFPELSRARLQEAFALGLVLLEGKPIAKSYRLRGGEQLSVAVPEKPETEVAATEGSLSILMEDEDVLVLNKAAGVVMHPGSGTGADTLAHFALHHTKGHLSRLGGTKRPGIVHRLDKDTTGVLVLAKSDRAYLALIRAFAGRAVKKEYVALVGGVPPLRSGSLREPIGRHPTIRVKMAVSTEGRGKAAHTDWAVEETFGKQAALVRCWLHTGRTHQIRVHLAHLGHPLLGDRNYGWKSRAGDGIAPARVMLHAAKLVFPHPADGRLVEMAAPLPPDFSALVAQLREKTRGHAKA